MALRRFLFIARRRVQSVDTSRMSLAQLRRHRREELSRQGGDLAEQDLEHAVAEATDDERRHSSDRDRARSGIEQGKLAEVRTCTELSDLVIAAPDRGATLEHDEERLARLAFAHDIGALCGFDDLHVAGDDAQVSFRAAREQRHRAETIYRGGA